MLISILYVLLGFVSVLMGLAILLQEPKQAGLSGAFGLGGDSQMLGTSPTSGIAKLTRFLALIFFGLCIGVSILAKEESSGSMMTEDDPMNPAVTSTTGEDSGLGDALGDDTATDDNAGTDSEGATDGAGSTEETATDGADESSDGENGTDDGSTDKGGADESSTDESAAGAEPSTDAAPATETGTPGDETGQR